MSGANDRRIVRLKIPCTRVSRRAIFSVSGIGAPTRKAIVAEHRRLGGIWANTDTRKLANAYFAIEDELEYRYRASVKMGPLPELVEELHRRRLILESELGDYETFAWQCDSTVRGRPRMDRS